MNQCPENCNSTVFPLTITTAKTSSPLGASLATADAIWASTGSGSASGSDSAAAAREGHFRVGTSEDVAGLSGRGESAARCLPPGAEQEPAAAAKETRRALGRTGLGARVEDAAKVEADGSPPSDDDAIFFVPFRRAAAVWIRAVAAFSSRPLAYGHRPLHWIAGGAGRGDTLEVGDGIPIPLSEVNRADALLKEGFGFIFGIM